MSRTKAGTALTPLLGDFLCIFKKPSGQWGTLNVSVKARVTEFGRSFDAKVRVRRGAHDQALAWLRHQVEVDYYADHLIPTLHLSGDLVSDRWVSEISQVNHARTRVTGHPLLQDTRWTGEFHESIARSVPLLGQVLAFGQRHGLDFSVAQSLVLAVLPHQLPGLDLDETLLLDRPWVIRPSGSHAWWNPADIWGAIGWDQA